MSKLKLSPNLFLEVNELKRFQKFIVDDGYKTLMKYLTKSYGIAINANNDFFKVSQKSDNSVMINTGVAFDEELNFIRLNEGVELEVSRPANNAQKTWIIISYAVSNEEVGLVNIMSDGTMTGFNTNFLSVLRGQPMFPTKVRLSSANNIDEYEVVSVNSDTEAVLAGSFTPEKGVKYQVIGTFTPGFTPNDEDKTIYEYDYCTLTQVFSESKPVLENGQFLLASVDFSQGVMQVTDERANNLFNYTPVNEENVSVANTDDDPFVALRKVKFRGERMIDIQFEWGYKITNFELSTTADANILSVLRGKSQYANVISTDNLLKGWLVVNRKNMVSVEIDYNIGASLYISKFSSSLITGENDDLVIVPNYQNIEVKVVVTGDNYDSDENALYQLFSIHNRESRITIPLQYGKNEVKLQYRLLSGHNSTSFKDFARTSYNAYSFAELHTQKFVDKSNLVIDGLVLPSTFFEAATLYQPTQQRVAAAVGTAPVASVSGTVQEAVLADRYSSISSLLNDSKFTITVNEPEEKERNYS